MNKELEQQLKRPLSVGDEVYYERNIAGIVTAKVERLTKTLAILDNGVRLVNTANLGWNRNEAYFNGYGQDNRHFFYRLTDKVRQRKKLQDLDLKVRNWIHDLFYSNDIEYKRKVYALANPGKVQKSK